MVQIGCFGLTILTETKITNKASCYKIKGYEVVFQPMIVTTSDGVQGEVCLVIWYQPQVWSVESTHFQGTNMVNFEVVTYRKSTPIIRT